MPITSYSTLQTAVVDWLEDRSDLAPFVPDFIAMAEGYFNTQLRVRQMETTAPLTTSTAGAASLPANFMEVIDVVSGVTNRPITYMTRGTGAAYYGGRGGQGAFYGINGSSLQLYPGGASGLVLTYLSRIPALSTTTTTNWLLQARPELYLRGALMMAAEFIKDNEEAAKQKALVDMIIGQMNMQDMRSRGRGGLQLRMATP
ncbi:MAG: hypothetical protein EOP20_03955 [Hyphomicrobiales bacterium]|nr:MAG: hypothetical protein EOP20_03955 [Hyphomicrobiales bacterium]